jgi:hypothetical protein
MRSNLQRCLHDLQSMFVGRGGLIEGFSGSSSSDVFIAEELQMCDRRRDGRVIGEEAEEVVLTSL